MVCPYCPEEVLNRVRVSGYTVIKRKSEGYDMEVKSKLRPGGNRTMTLLKQYSEQLVCLLSL